MGELRGEALEQAADFDSKIRSTLATQGVDTRGIKPSQLLNQSGEFIEEFNTWVPQTIADAVAETRQSRDFVKAAVGGSEFGTKLLDLFDSSTRFMKTTVTLPFPAYWTGNVMGDGLFRLFDGGFSAHDPGLTFEVGQTLLGKGGIRTSFGQTIDPSMFKRLLITRGLITQHRGT